MDPAADPWPPPHPPGPLAVLCSGGLDSGVLLGEAARAYPVVFPVFVRVGSVWEDAEFAHLERFLLALNAPAVRPVVVLRQPVDDLLAGHWSLTGAGVPPLGAPDADSFLPGRNVLLLAKPLLWCLLRGVPELATAPLAGNPFPDATPSFYDGFARLVGDSVSGTVRVLRPYARLDKAAVIRRGAGLPLQHTLSCASPADGLHCGRCSKCGERMAGFASAGVPDPTAYRN